MRVRYIIGPDASVDTGDRGLAYGDGLFETMAVRNHRVVRLGLHLDRLRLGCTRLSLPLPDTNDLTRRLAELAESILHGSLKLILTRGSGARGYAPPERPEPLAILAATAAPERPARRDLTVVSLETRLGENEKLAGIKHLCRLEQVLGQLELADHQADEGIMLSASGHVIGGTCRNLFAAFGARLVTPAVSRAGIAGVMRRAVLDQCSRMGIAVTEGDMAAEDLLQADELFMTNALVGIQSVARLDDHRYAATAMADRLRQAIDGDSDA